MNRMRCIVVNILNIAAKNGCSVHCSSGTSTSVDVLHAQIDRAEYTTRQPNIRSEKLTASMIVQVLHSLSTCWP